jgi:hypothetical protein
VILISLKLHDNDSFYSWFLREEVFLNSVYERVMKSASSLKSYVRFVMLFTKRNWCSPYRFGSCNFPHCLEAELPQKDEPKIVSCRKSIAPRFFCFFYPNISSLPNKKSVHISSESPVRNRFKQFEKQCLGSITDCYWQILYFSFVFVVV